jgi:hypothetical protein
MRLGVTGVTSSVETGAGTSVEAAAGLVKVAIVACHFHIPSQRPFTNTVDRWG